MATRNFRQLQVWQRAHLLVLDLYRETKGFPFHERYGITSQMRRAAVSIPTNIAEGCGRRTNPDFRRFLGFATGSLSEVEYLIMLTYDLGYITENRYNTLITEVIELRKMLVTYSSRLIEDKRTKH